MEGHTGLLIRALNVRYNPGRLPVLVFSHGFGSDQSVWRNTISKLRKDPQFTDSGLLTYDLAFSGKVGKDFYSTNKHRYETIDGYVEDILHVLQHYHIRQCVYIGHCISGMIGIVASTRHRDLFAHLILIGTAPCFVDRPKYRIGYSRKKANQRLELMEVDYKRFVEEYIDIALPKAKGKFKIKLNSMLCNMTPEVAKSTASMIFSTDLRDLVSNVTTECTIISTCSNTIASAFGQNYMLAQMKNASVTKINTKGHFPHHTKGKLVAEEISNVIRKWRREEQPSSSICGLVSYDSLWEQNVLLRRQVEALEQDLQNNRIYEETLAHERKRREEALTLEMKRREEALTQQNMLLKRRIEVLQNHQPELPDIRSSLQYHSASTIAMQHCQPETPDERTLALLPQVTEAMNHQQPVVPEQSTSASPFQISDLGLDGVEFDFFSAASYTTEDHIM